MNSTSRKVKHDTIMKPPVTSQMKMNKSQNIDMFWHAYNNEESVQTFNDKKMLKRRRV